MGTVCGTGTMNYTECGKTCKTKLHPIPRSECGAPSGGTNDTCVNGAKPKYYKSKSAYAVAVPGDVAGMQKEIMTNGPIEVAFYVYGEFESYKKGMYTRSAKEAEAGPKGGHAVSHHYVAYCPTRFTVHAFARACILQFSDLNDVCLAFPGQMHRMGRRAGDRQGWRPDPVLADCQQLVAGVGRGGLLPDQARD